MARLLITTEEGKEIRTNGHVTFEMEKVYSEELEEDIVITRGKLAIHEYIEDIYSIETDRYILIGIDVVKEVFGTNDYNILYEFTLTTNIGFAVKPEYLTDEQRQGIELEEYSEDEKHKIFNPEFLGGEEVWN